MRPPTESRAPRLSRTTTNFCERVAFIHEKHNSDAIAEEYIPGRELYGSVIGNNRLNVFPIRELVFQRSPA